MGWIIRDGDCRDELLQLDPETVQLIFTSPPYAQEKSYEQGLDYNGLQALMGGVALNAFPAVRPGGFCVVNFGETTKYNPRTMCQLYTTVFSAAGWLMHSRRIWAKMFARCSLTGLNNIHTIPVAEYEHIYTFRKPPNDREIIRSKLSYHAIWDAKGTAGYSDHPAPFPPDLAAKAIEVWTDPGDLVVDPFNGVGSTGVACVQMQREYIGIELNPKWAEDSRQRLGQAETKLLV